MTEKTKKKTRVISDEKLQEVIGFTPHDKQVDIIRVVPKMREVVLAAGRRFGKSALCAYIALKYLLQDNKNIWIVAPNYDLTLKVFNYLVRWYSIVAPSGQKGITNRPYPRIKTPRGSVLECKSTENPKSLLGEELDLMIVDEAAQIDKRVWEQYLFPTLASRQGKVIFISTPLGKNWFHDQFVKADHFGGAFSYESRDNPHFPKDEWERAREMLPQHVFRQEYQAAFLDEATSVFRNLKDIIHEGVEADARSGYHYIIGADLAKYQDFTVLTVVEVETNIVRKIERFNAINWELQKLRIRSLAERYNNARIVIDSTGIGDPVVEDLQRTGMIVDDVKFTTNAKNQLINKLSIFVDKRKITIPPHPDLMHELEVFGLTMTDGGVMKYSAPQGHHDDCVISLALAVSRLNDQPAQEVNQLKKQMKTAAKKNRRNFV